MTTILGMDVSHWEGVIDWDRVAAWRSLAGDPIRFVVAKCTEGVDFFDPTYLPNMAGAERIGRDRCGYHYFHPDLDKDAQLEWFLKHRVPGTIPDGLDDEEENDETGVRINSVKHAARTYGWLASYRARVGIIPWLYCNLNFIRNIFIGTDRPGLMAASELWLAWPSGTAPAMGTYEQPGIIQYNWKGKVDGVPGDVDMNRYMGTEADYLRMRLGKPPVLAEQKLELLWNAHKELWP